MSEEQTDEMKVDIVDDTPPEDRNRTPLPQNIVEELEKDELDKYSDGAKKRINQLKKVWHDERRAKEALAREKEEAVAFAKRAYEENRQLKQRLGTGERVFIKEVSKAAETELNTAKEALKRAYESGDAEKITEAQEALIEAKSRVKEVSGFKPSIQEDELSVKQPAQPEAPRQQQRSAQVPDPKAEAWRQNNEWFGSDEEMTALALGLHEKLVRSGVDPKSDDYYKRIDDTMKKRFPDYFEDAQPTEEEVEKPAPRKVSTVVAPATRSTSSRQIRITASEAAIAKRLGLTPEAYAREKLKLENTNG